MTETLVQQMSEVQEYASVAQKEKQKLREAEADSSELG